MPNFPRVGSHKKELYNELAAYTGRGYCLPFIFIVRRWLRKRQWARHLSVFRSSNVAERKGLPSIIYGDMKKTVEKDSLSTGHGIYILDARRPLVAL